ncbi:hypothetical protein LEP1GSC133_0612 [Leptospira borgpetersenii serovar Pomona str. 200901868]|uniref:Uncharacterized protein n=1 Tax=Leptospira borgpetersenii serovar Pomona str. 200901868 TaxID=1192866 RepID=M6WEX9_LEPBO|nr:hypothetical protein LEP1GSC133_0612 [Leptospira borgpetersenii serovar Pomona str. 200901868]
MAVIGFSEFKACSKNQLQSLMNLFQKLEYGTFFKKMIFGIRC